MTIEKNNILRSKGKKPIVYDLYFTKNTTKKPLVIFCHGYKGFKDWGAWHLVAQTFADAGYFFLKFNFSHNGGTVEDPIDFPDLESFASNTFSTELDDLKRILDFITSEKDYSLELNSEALHLIGHSRGGGISLIKAEEDSKVKSVTTWASVCDFKARFLEDSETFKLWKKTGITHVENGRTKQQMPHYFHFYTDFKENETRLTIKRAVENLQKPQLIIHGSEDPTVSLKEAKALHQWNSNSQLEVIQGADHVFGAMHPWNEEQLTEDLRKAVALTIRFLK